MKDGNWKNIIEANLNIKDSINLGTGFIKKEKEQNNMFWKDVLEAMHNYKKKINLA